MGRERGRAARQSTAAGRPLSDSIDDRAYCQAATSEVLHLHARSPGVTEPFERPLREHCSRLTGRNLSEEEFTAIRRDWEIAHARHRPQCLRPGALAAIELAAAMGCSQSVLSMTPYEDLLRDIDLHGLSGSFVLAEGSYGDPVSKVSLLTAHLKGLGLRPSRVLLVGDTEDDHATAATTGTRFAWVNSGYERSAQEAIGNVDLTAIVAAALKD